MRLTLRTLLAYLDDTLEPAQARTIGQKVAESPAAQELIARIKQVTRRRRLTAPPMTGPDAKLDPNAIAEYLDNVLAPEQQAQVEEVCLDSDLYLAEVAACHQILTLVLGQPALVPPTARQRMYGLVHGREAIPGRKAPVPAVGPAALETPPPQEDDADETLLLGLPRYGRANRLRWAVPLTAACLLLLACVAIWMALASGRRQVTQALPPTNPEANAVAQAGAAGAHAEQPGPARQEPEPAKPPAEQPRQPPQAASKPPEKQPQGPAPAKPGPASASGNIGGGFGAPENPTPPGGKAAGPGTPAPAVPNQPPSPPPEAAPSPVQPPRTERVELGRTSLRPGEPSILMTRQPDQGKWQRLGVQAPVMATDYLVSLPGYHSELRLERGIHVLLWGNVPQFDPAPVLESGVRLYANPSFDLDCELERGRVLFSNHKDGPARARLRFQGEVWDLTLPDQTSEVAVELFGFPAPFVKGKAEAPLLRVLVWGLRGEAELRVRQERHLLASPALFTWDSVHGVGGLPQRVAVPVWVTNPVPATRDARAMQAALDGLSRRLLDSSTIDVAVAEAVQSSDPASRALALRCRGAMDDWPHLIDALADGQHADVRFLAIEEFEHLLGLSADNDEKLVAALQQKNYSPGQAQTIDRLLHGFSPEEWAVPDTKTTVLEYLGSDKLAIRQLAHWVLLRQLPQGARIHYDPAGDSGQRERGYEMWRRLVMEGELPSTREPQRRSRQ